MGNTKCVCIAREDGAVPREDETALLTGKLSELEDEIRKLRDERARITEQCKVVRMEADRAAATCSASPNSNGRRATFGGASPRVKHIAAIDNSPRSLHIEESTSQRHLEHPKSDPQSGPTVTDASRPRAVSAPSTPTSARRDSSRVVSAPSTSTQSKESSETKVAVRQVLASAFAFAAVTLMSDEEVQAAHAAVMAEHRKEACLLARFSVHSVLAYAAVANLSEEELAALAGEVLLPEETMMSQTPEKAEESTATPSVTSSSRQPSDSDKEATGAAASAAAAPAAAAPAFRKSVSFRNDGDGVDATNATAPEARPKVFQHVVSAALAPSTMTPAARNAQRRATVSHVSASVITSDSEKGDSGDEADGNVHPVLRARTSILALRQSALELRAGLAALASSTSTPPRPKKKSSSFTPTIDAPSPKKMELRRRQSAPALLVDKAPKVSNHVSAAEIGRKLVELLFEFPQAATKGVRWEVLERLYEERHGFSLDLFAPSVRTALMFDGLRKLKTGTAWSPVLGLEDEALLAQSWIRHSPGRLLACWPSLYAALCRALEEEFGVGPGASMECVRGPLEELESLLRSSWHPGFDARSLSFRDLNGHENSIADMQDLVEAMLRWRTERVELQQAGNARFSAVDEAILPRLDLEDEELTLRRARSGSRASIKGPRASIKDVERELQALRAANAELQVDPASA